MCTSKEQSVKLAPTNANLEIAIHGVPSVATVATLEDILSKIVRLASLLATDFIRYNHEISHSYFVAQQSFFTKSSHLLLTPMNKWNYHNLWPKIQQPTWQWWHFRQRLMIFGKKVISVRESHKRITYKIHCVLLHWGKKLNFCFNFYTLNFNFVFI